jgi:sporulation protein YlmC with PRC-barrel domain
MVSDSVQRDMTDILAENLSGKTVMGTDGAEIGMLYNITMDLESGHLSDLVIEPAEGVSDQRFDVDNQGRYLVPVSRVSSVSDHMIIER